MTRKSQDKLLLLRTLIEVEIQLGYDITNLIGRPLSYFDWDKVANLLEQRMVEFKETYKYEYGS
jgi:hypothetical protein